MDEKNAELLRSRSRAAFDAQAPTYDTGTEGEHARRLYPHVLAEVRRAVAAGPAPRLLDLGCGTGSCVWSSLPFGNGHGFLSGSVTKLFRVSPWARR